MTLQLHETFMRMVGSPELQPWSADLYPPSISVGRMKFSVGRLTCILSIV